jgi:hypothetical protein
MARRVYVLKRRNSLIGIIIGVVVILAVLALTNPKIGDFRNYARSVSAEYQLASNVTGDRQDYFFFSTFNMTIRLRDVKYLGLCKVIFIKI